MSIVELVKKSGLWDTIGNPKELEVFASLVRAEALAESVKQEPVACQDSDDRRLLREVFMLCEATEEIEATNDFMRGRVFEAKGIRRGIGTWYQDTFCGRSYMGEPVIPAAPLDAKALRAEALEEAKEIAKTIGGSFADEFLAAIRGLK